MLLRNESLCFSDNFTPLCAADIRAFVSSLIFLFAADILARVSSDGFHPFFDADSFALDSGDSLCPIK